MATINKKAFEGAPIRKEDRTHERVGTVGKVQEPKKGDTRENGTERYNGTKWVKVNKVKEASKKAVRRAKSDDSKRPKSSVYVGNR